MQSDRPRFPAHPAVEPSRSDTPRPTQEIAPEPPPAVSEVAIDARAFRVALGHYASGITVVTGLDGRGLFGFTCQSFHSVSTSPPLVSFSVQKTSTTYPRLRDVGSFAVSVLARDQQHLSDQFAKSGADKWKDVGWSPARTGNPVLDGSLAWLDCRVRAEHEAGDHLIIIGEIKELSAPDGPSRDPLVYFKGRYRQLKAE